MTSPRVARSLPFLVAALFLGACGNNNTGSSAPAQPAPAPATSNATGSATSAHATSAHAGSAQPTNAQVTNPQATATLTVKIVDVRNKTGQLTFGVFTSADGFPSDSKKAVNWQTRNADARDAGDDKTVTFTCQLPPGTYGASVLHDENKNNQMDTRLGIPREGYGVTNNPKPRFRAAKFSESLFTLPAEGATLTISIQYF